ncbi:MAG: adenosylmethionine--8-amino-7-oxononanoate transaminase [Proteobacteria bacterium]|nr:adenosylmethionine--8-amino-7-oxononanoate transaminase [Pseudomonadota bacterium]
MHTRQPAKPPPEISVPDWYRSGIDHVWLPYTQMQTTPPPLPVARTSGSRIFLADGRVLIDGIASWWTACHGYNHPHIRQAVNKQLEQMPHIMFGGLAHAPALSLAARLAKLLPGDLDRVFFSDSGSVAVEIAMKMALQYRANRGETQRTRFIALRGGYHGDTAGAMAVSDPDMGMHRPGSGLAPAQIVIEPPLDERALARFDDAIERHAASATAIIAEPLVQGAGGMIFHTPDVLRCLRAAADRHGLLLILDEIFTGFGRTGTLFAAAAAGVVADIVTLSKALTGGTLALAATVARRHVYEAFLAEDAARALMHGPTFMANPLACAAANASLDLFERAPHLEEVAAIGEILSRGLAPCRNLPGVRDVRVMGAIGVVEMARIADLEGLRRRFVEKGVFVRPFGNVIYLTPAFTIAVQDLETLTRAVVEVVREG